MAGFAIMDTLEDDVLGYVEAPDEDEAVARWLVEAGYDSIEEAAEECFCDAADIKAVPSKIPM